MPGADAQAMNDVPSRQQDDRSVREEVVAWARVTFPRRTLQTVLAHLLRACNEWTDDPHNPEEMADVVLLIAPMPGHRDNLDQQVHLIARQDHVDLTQEVTRKLEINRQRTWQAPDGQGVVAHVRTPHDAAGAGKETRYAQHTDNDGRPVLGSG